MKLLRTLDRRSPLKTTLIVLYAILLLSPLLSQAQASKDVSDPPVASQEESTPVFRGGTSLVLVDVIVQDPKTGIPVNTLRQEDFRLSDNGHEVAITTFDSGAHNNTRPVALWFVVICNEKGNGPNGQEASGGFLGKETLFRSALDDLDKNDSVGVAHWCDNGEAKLDLQPTANRDAAIAALSEVLKPNGYDTPPPSQRRDGELALQRMLRLIIADAHQRNPQPLPVLFVLHSDYTGTLGRELDHLVNDFLETSGIVFGIKDADVHDFFFGPLGDREMSIWHYMAMATGGQYFSVHSDLYSTALQSVLLQLHFRYELGFKPRAIDGKRHKLKVEFVGEAKQQHKSTDLRFRPEYIPKAN